MKRIICLVLSLLILVLFVSCSSFKQIEDTNGSEDYSVCSITDEQILKADSSISFLRVSSFVGSEGKLSIEKFSGVYTVTKLTKNKTLLIDVNVESGNLRVCVIKDKTIVADIPINELSTLNLSKGSIIKVCGESAKFEITLSQD